MGYIKIRKSNDVSQCNVCGATTSAWLHERYHNRLTAAIQEVCFTSESGTHTHSVVVALCDECIKDLHKVVGDYLKEKREGEKPKGPFVSIEAACDALGWDFDVDDNGDVAFSKYSPAGEDFSFIIDHGDITNIDDIIYEAKKHAADFDVDDHIEMWIEARQNGVQGIPGTARELVEDAEAIQEMLDALVEALEQVEISKNNCELGNYDCETCGLRDTCARYSENQE